MKKIAGFVVVLLAIGLTIPTTRARMADAVSPFLERFRGSLVPTRLETMANQLDEIARQGRPLPTDWGSWLRESYRGVPEDPWGNLYYIDTSRRASYTVGSMGPDGELATEDDITLQRDLPR